MIINCKMNEVKTQAVQWIGYNQKEITNFTNNIARFIWTTPYEPPILYLNQDTCCLNDYILKINDKYYIYDCIKFKEDFTIME